MTHKKVTKPIIRGQLFIRSLRVIQYDPLCGSSVMLCSVNGIFIIDFVLPNTIYSSYGVRELVNAIVCLMLSRGFKESENSDSYHHRLYFFYYRNARPFHLYLNLTYFLKQTCYTPRNWIFDIFSIYHFDIFQIMKFLSTIFATMTSGLVVESGFQNNQALFIDNPSSPSLLRPISRSKRDLIGFNRQANNNFSHRRQWDNRMGMFKITEAMQGHLVFLDWYQLKEKISIGCCKIRWSSENNTKNEQF